jgi:glycine/D-amino acid oxidase-like deaminating enzyme
MSDTADITVIGGGVVGSAIGYGLARRGNKVVVLDEGDDALRASRVNFGLVWLHSKGDGMPAYGFWTRRSADLWPSFSDEIRDLTGIDMHYRKTGGLSFCLGEAEYGKRTDMISRMKAQGGEDPYETEMIDRRQLESLVPKVTFGPEVLGASFGPHDGAVNPLLLLRGLHTGMKACGADYRPGTPALEVVPQPRGFRVVTPTGLLFSRKVVLAAGHGITPLMGALGFDVDIIAQRGQQFVTERVKPILPIPANGIRQTLEGTIMIGASKEYVGYNVSTTPQAGAAMAARAIRVIPALKHVRIVRAWAGIRTMTKDDCPVYEESAAHPGAYLATCHSGVTLAAVHAIELADAIHESTVATKLADFHGRRFHEQQ